LADGKAKSDAKKSPEEVANRTEQGSRGEGRDHDKSWD
jgi:hypothetical protein